MTDHRANKATVDDPGLQGEFRKGFGDGQTDEEGQVDIVGVVSVTDSATTDDVVELTVEDLMVLLGDMPADSKVALMVHGTVAEVFNVVYNDETSWVLLEG